MDKNSADESIPVIDVEDEFRLHDKKAETMQSGWNKDRYGKFNLLKFVTSLFYRILRVDFSRLISKSDHFLFL